ncbi:hypothetical protein LCGC14_2535150, partial [marine sediment metagenome]
MDDPILNRALGQLDEELNKIARVFIDWTDASQDFLTTGTLTVPNEGLHVLDTNASHDLVIKAGSDLTADRILSFVTGNAARTITLSGDPTLDDWFDQAVKQASNVTFGTLRSGELTVDSGAGCSIKIKGTSTGNANIGWIGFYDSDGTTRRGYIGDGSSANDDIYLGTDTGDLRLVASGTVILPTGSTIGNLTLANGSITDSGGTISFGSDVYIPAKLLVLDKASDKGIKVDTTTPTYGWADLIGDQFAKNTGATKPTLVAYNGVINSWQFAASDEAFITYHIPHDYVKGT